MVLAHPFAIAGGRLTKRWTTFPNAIALILTPNSNQANCAASEYGATTASKASRRASDR